MPGLPRRTGQTELSTPELLLFDFLWPWWVPRYALDEESYALHMNCTYSHGLTNDALDATLRSLVDRQLVKQDNDGNSFTLTQAGGEAWENERVPKWSHRIQSWMNASCNTQFKIVAANETIGRAYIDGLVASGQITLTSTVQVCDREDYGLIPWRRNRAVDLIAYIAANEPDVEAMDWGIYEARRVWWRDIHELDTLTAEP